LRRSTCFSRSTATTSFLTKTLPKRGRRESGGDPKKKKGKARPSPVHMGGKTVPAGCPYTDARPHVNREKSPYPSGEGKKKKEPFSPKTSLLTPHSNKRGQQRTLARPPWTVRAFGKGPDLTHQVLLPSRKGGGILRREIRPIRGPPPSEREVESAHFPGIAACKTRTSPDAEDHG